MQRAHAAEFTFSGLTRGLLGLMAFMIFAGPVALAQESGWYGGVNLGATRAKIDDARIIGGLAAGRLTTTSINDDDRDVGYKLFGGYQLNRNFAVEGGYFDLGKFGFTANTLPPGTLTGRIKVRGLNLDLVGSLPVTERFALFARVGANHAEARDTFSGTGLVHVLNANPRSRETNIKYGAGLQYAINDRLGIRAEVERYRIDDAVGNKGDIDMLSIGLIYRFGGRTAPVRMAQAAPAARAVQVPEPVAAPPVITPSPAPVIAAPPPRQPLKVSFSADALFDFNKAIIKPDGRQALGKFAADLKTMRFESIMVTGHTDRIGTEAYNLALSTRRAEAVKAYLLGTSALTEGKIVVRGVGESQPVTRPQDCKGRHATPPLIACLQPDRRVDVEASGTR